MAKKEQKKQGFRLVVPLDASQIEDRGDIQQLNVALVRGDETVRLERAKLDRGGKGTATFSFDARPESLQVVVGPPDASAEEMRGLQTIAVDVPSRRWAEEAELELPAVRVTPTFWHWWLRWCRTFTIRGRVVCADGSPVPGAEVCAFDVDRFWWWCSRQQVGCATTDAQGAFEITFRWCCGWWPWWWWQQRRWRIDPQLVERIQPVLEHDINLGRIPTPSPLPDPRVFEPILADPDSGISRPLASQIDPAQLEGLRGDLLERLPHNPELERLRIWPWFPWQPWWDCTPDINFRVTQNCHGEEATIVNEGCTVVRWNIPQTMNVTLVANEEACCIPPMDGCEGGDCLAITSVCDDLANTIGGNVGAAPSPEGYKNPGLVSPYGDRPYAGNIPISGTVTCMDNVDYYAFEYSTDGGATWTEMPEDAAGVFNRTYIDFSTSPYSWHPVQFKTSPISGHHVYETLQHYEANNPPANWGSDRIWVGSSRDLLMRWLTNAADWVDGAYMLRVKGWNETGGALTDERVMKVCNSDDDAFVIVTLDNRLEGAASGHPASTPSHPTGPGTVHTQTLEPDSDFLSVKILRGLDEIDIGACGNEELQPGDRLRIDFLAHDPDGHLAYYTLHNKYGENMDINLLSFLGNPGVSLTALSPMTQVGPYYGHGNPSLSALSQGALSPSWQGGRMRLELPADLAFPVTCCYQLELRAHKRTILNCSHSLSGHTNFSEYSFMVVV